MTVDSFILTHVESELLLAFEQARSLEDVSRRLGRDMTVVSKQFKRISEKGDYLAKVGGRWVLTDQGQRHNRLVKDFFLAQGLLGRAKVSLRIGSTREFSARVLAPAFAQLQAAVPEATFTLYVFEQGIETALLNGEVDMGFDCGRPYSPEIQFRNLIEEEIVAVASPRFLKKHSISKISDALNSPSLEYSRLPLRQTLSRLLAAKLADPPLVFCNDLATLRSMCLANLGWSVLPYYVVRQEIANKQLALIPGWSSLDKQYGVWHLRSRAPLRPYVEAASGWLKTIKLSS